MWQNHKSNNFSYIEVRGHILSFGRDFHFFNYITKFLLFSGEVRTREVQNINVGN